MMNDGVKNEAKEFIKTHFYKSEWKSCKLNTSQLADLVSSASNGIKINAYELEQLLRDMGYRNHLHTGRYMMRLSDRLSEYARDRMCFM